MLFRQSSADYKRDVILSTICITILIVLTKLIYPMLIDNSSENSAALKEIIDDCRYSFSESQQTTSPQQQLQNLSKASAYLSVARRMTSDIQIERLTGTDIYALHKAIDGAKREAKKTLNMKCPLLNSPHVQTPIVKHASLK